MYACVCFFVYVFYTIKLFDGKISKVTKRKRVSVLVR